ncbi:uncharacterized protein BYT42DRAFT_549259 [Radiomyces spectabilis]|uniref:uncharacterized protein n=1 Tax=Radiomyces spectabilis TaxID=64574 RepID=UPI00221E525C|nr:uncharacterized protein BYT42DRAFT_549259 [Radiomyces spectabilis]KAI8369598.1 hypothetical protein BYT42DRAFT_549259 [Radiomyces spectabilis]
MNLVLFKKRQRSSDENDQEGQDLQGAIQESRQQRHIGSDEYGEAGPSNFNRALQPLPLAAQVPGEPVQTIPPPLPKSGVSKKYQKPDKRFLASVAKLVREKEDKEAGAPEKLKPNRKNNEREVQ